MLVLHLTWQEGGGIDAGAGDGRTWKQSGIAVARPYACWRGGLSGGANGRCMCSGHVLWTMEILVIGKSAFAFVG